MPTIACDPHRNLDLHCPIHKSSIVDRSPVFELIRVENHNAILLKLRPVVFVFLFLGLLSRSSLPLAINTVLADLHLTAVQRLVRIFLFVINVASRRPTSFAFDGNLLAGALAL